MRRVCTLVAAGLCLTAGSATAAPTLPGELTNDLVRANECEYCHTYNNAADAVDDPSYAPYFSWRGSMMANAAVDPVFWAGVAIASQDAVAPEETEACIRCHSPRAFLEGRGDATEIGDLLDRDLAGIECDFCHRMEDDGGIGNGQYAVDDTLVGGNVPRRGPWTYGVDEITPPPHSWIQDNFVGSSEACGTCHDVTTDRARVDDDGNPTGAGFNEQRTYSEWSRSAFAVPGDDFRSCQDCHMPAVPDMPGCREHVDVHAHETGGRRHDLVGANRFVVSLLAEDATVLDGIGFDHTLEVMDAFVATSASLEVEAPDTVDLGQGLQDLTVTVTNETGHKLPTGYSEGRIMWIQVIARYEGDFFAASGAVHERTGLLIRDPQLRTYQGVAEEYATGQSLHLLRNDHWIEDTRIPPRGLTPDVETDPVGERYALQDDGTWPHFDTVTYGFEGDPELAGVDSGELEVSVRLMYLINTPEYVDFLEAENVTNDAGADVALLFSLAGGSRPLVVAEQIVSIPVAQASGTSTGGGDSGSTSAASSAGTAGDTSGTTDPTTASGSDTAPSGSDDVSSSSTAGADGGGGEGCSCRSTGGGHPGWLLLGLFGGLWRRRRRR